MKSTFKVLFYVKRNAVRKNDHMPIIARITVDGKISQFSTKLEVNPELWSVKLGRASGLSRESKQINALLDEIKASIHKVYHELQRRDSVATTTTLAKGVPIETVSKMLGHTNIETTQIYARITNSKISQDMKGLSDKFIGSEKLFIEHQNR